MARIIAITNNKGGCGKTTTAVNMGAALRLRGFDVLLIDYDGQANLTATLGVEALNGSTVYDAVKRPDTPYIQPARVLYPTASGCGVLDVLPACEDLAAVDVEQAREPDRVTRLTGVVNLYAGKYDVILIDTPPALGLQTIAALYAADETIITVQPQYLAVGGLVRLSGSIATINANRTNRPALFSRVLFTQYDRRKGLHRATVEQVTGAGFLRFNTVIRDNVALGEAPAAALDIFRYAPNSYGAQDYAALTAEYLNGTKLGHAKHGYKII